MAIIGTGWSGSGALIDVLKQQSLWSGYPYELDFWRRHNGLNDSRTVPDLFRFFFQEFLHAVIVILKTCCKMLVRPFACNDHLASIAVEGKMAVLMCAYAFFALLRPDVHRVKTNFVKGLKFAFGSKRRVFVYDQALFVEQIETSNLEPLNVGACIIIVRDVFDQMEDMARQSTLLPARTIREAFFVGAKSGLGDESDGLQMELMLHALRHRIRKVGRLARMYPKSLLILKFEDLVLNTEDAISQVNRFLGERGFPASFIDADDAASTLVESKQNIGIGNERKWAQLKLMEEINDEINRLVTED